MQREQPQHSSLADIAALGGLLEQQRPKLLSMLKRRIDPILGARLDAEDILNDAFLQAKNKWKQFDASSDVTAIAWLYRLTLDAFIEAFRRETRLKRNMYQQIPWPEESFVQLGLGLFHQGTSPSEAAIRAETAKRVRNALELLKETDREILWLRHFDELSFKDAAHILGIEESAASMRYVRALQRFKNLWQQVRQTRDSSS